MYVSKIWYVNFLFGQIPFLSSTLISLFRYKQNIADSSHQKLNDCRLLCLSGCHRDLQPARSVVTPWPVRCGQGFHAPCQVCHAGIYLQLQPAQLMLTRILPLTLPASKLHAFIALHSLIIFLIIAIALCPPFSDSRIPELGSQTC